MIRTYGDASSGMISGSGLAIAKTSGSFAIFFRSSTVMSPGPARPRNRSAPAMTSDSFPFSLNGLVCAAYQSFMKFMCCLRPL